MAGASSRSRVLAASGILAALLAGSLLTWGAFAFAEDEPKKDEKAGPGWDGDTAFSGPCGIRDIRAQQLGTDLRPDDPSVRGALHDAGVGVGLADRGFCVDLNGAAFAPDWTVDGVRLTAGTAGQRWSWSSPAKGQEDFDAVLRVPVPGCARVRVVADVRNEDGVTGTWSLRETYGWGCEKAPGKLYPPGTPRDRR